MGGNRNEQNCRSRFEGIRSQFLGNEPKKKKRVSFVVALHWIMKASGESTFRKKKCINELRLQDMFYGVVNKIN